MTEILDLADASVAPAGTRWICRAAFRLIRIRSIAVQRPCLALAIGILIGANPAGAATILSPAQSAVIAKRASSLRSAAERQMVESWSDTKKVAEFLCRPAALVLLRNRIKGADRVFLGLGQDDDLRLVSNQLLTGKGEVRTSRVSQAGGWRDFGFSCRLNPLSGRVIAFEPVLSDRGPH